MAKSNPRKRKTTKKRKNKFIIPPGIIIGGVFFLIVSLIAITIMNIKVNTLKKDNKTSQYTKADLTANNIDHYISTILKNFKQNNDFIKKRDITEYGNNFELNYEIILKENISSKFKNSLTEKMRQYNFSVADSGTTLKYTKSGKMLTIHFVEEENAISKKPVEKVVKKSTGPKISIILDDAGRDLVNLKRILSNPYPITISTLPFTRYDRKTVELTKKAGKTAFLHLPCQPKSYPKTNPGKGAIFLNTPPTLINVTLQKVFERLGKVDGFNNHMGSALTENRKKMIQVLKEAKKYTNTFVDSRTSLDTVAYDVCLEMNMTCGMNRKFIDNKNDHSYIKDRLNDSVQYAKKHGEAIIIGHLKPDTIDVLIEYLPVLEKEGIHIVPLSEVLH